MRRWLLLLAVSLTSCGVALPADDQFLSEHDADQDTTDVADAPDTADLPDADDSVDAADALDVVDTADAPDAVDAADAQDIQDSADSADAPDVSDSADAPDAVDVLDATDALAGTDADAADAATDVEFPDVVADAATDADLAEIADDVTDDAAEDVADVADGEDAAVDGGPDAEIDADDAEVTPACDPATCPDDGNPCTSAACDGGGACTNVPNTATCDDLNACTQNDVCAASACTGTTFSCDDGNACTSDSCEPTTGCVNAGLNGQPCNDNSVCTSGDTCADSVCVPGSTTTCDDNNVCTSDNCSPTDGCTHVAVSGAQTCSDGNPCTANDACVGATCTPGAAVVCTAPDVCHTAGTCATDSGLCAGQVAISCDDSDSCTVDACEINTGGCVHTAKCTDGSACTLDVCGASGECSFPPTLFDATFGGTGYDMGTGIDTLADGFILTGKSNNVAGEVENALLIRTDLAGKQLWSKSFGASGYDGGVSVAARADGFAIAGYTTSKGAGSYDYWLIRTDIVGNLLWDKTYGDSAADQNFGMAALPDGYILNGMGNGTLTGNPAGWLVRTDLDGNKLWDKGYAVGIWDSANQVKPTSDGGFVFAGSTYAAPGGKSDAWLVRLDGSGNELWSRTYGGSANDSAWGVVPVADGFAVAGQTASSGAGSGDMWLIRTDAQGQKLWDRTYGGPGDDTGGAIALLQDGFALGGYKIVNGSNVGYLVRTDLDGNALWQKTYLSVNTGINRVIALPDGFATYGWTMDHGAGDDDDWLQRTDSFGNVSCTTSGGCFGKTPQGCDDGNACTADACTAGTCSHAPMPDWTVCGNNQICNGSGVCGDVAASKGMARIPAGSFWMGCNSAKDGNCDSIESPQHKVTLSSYYIDLTETTAGAYKTCVDAGACSLPQYSYPDGGGTYPDLADHAVNHVNWAQARQYCQWRGDGFDLPTEAQWEMAARGRCEENGFAASDPACAAGMRTYPWGEPAADCAHAVVAACGAPTPLAVGTKSAGDSPFGVHDMAGNVFEWVGDGYAKYDGADAIDPPGPDITAIRVDRGGSFQHGPTLQRGAFRSASAFSGAYVSLGFRCAKSFPVWTQCSGKPDGTVCSDGNLCTTGDACKSGSCVPGSVPTCADGNSCTDDLCAVGVGCSHSNNALACSDGSLCTSGDLCVGGTCKSGTAKVCADSDSCTLDACDAATGQCTFTFNAAQCQQWDKAAWDQSAWGP